MNFTDPGGYYRWTSLPYGQWQHQVIEDEIEKIYGGAGGWKIHSEYRVKLPKKEWRRVDLIYFPDAYDQTSAFYPFGNAKGYIYEIEPFDPYEPSGYLIGLGEATWYANLLQVNSFYQFNETGGRTRYNWQDINWEVGSKRIPQDIMFIPINPTGELVVWYEPVGVILYADSRWINDQSDRIKRLPPPVIQKWNDHEDSNLTKEQKQFIAMVNLANKNQPVDEEALLSAGLCDVLILLALQIGKEAVEVAICGPCSLVIP